MATPILLAALGETIVERSGVLNIGIEGSMLCGAFFGLTAAYFSGSVPLGLLAGFAAGIAINALLAVLVINLTINQVVGGTAIDIFALGFTGVLYRRFFGVTGTAATISSLAPCRARPARSNSRCSVPSSSIRTLIVYATFLLVPVVAYVLSRTRYGLWLRAAGERPEAADALGLNVYRLRWEALLIAGALTGLGGAYLTLAYANTFVEGISAGRGYVALAVVIVGRWNAYGVARPLCSSAVRWLCNSPCKLRHRCSLPALSRASVCFDPACIGFSRRSGSGSERPRRTLPALVAISDCSRAVSLWRHS